MRVVITVLLTSLALAGCVTNRPPGPPLASAQDPKVLERREEQIAVRVANWSAGLQPRGTVRLGEIRNATISGPRIRAGGDEEIYCVGVTEYFETPKALIPEKFEAKYGMHVRIFRRNNLIALSRQNYCEPAADTRSLPYLVYYRRLQQARIDVAREYQDAAKAAKSARSGTASVQR